MISTNMYGQANGVRLDGEEILTYTFDSLGRLTSRKLNTDTPYIATTLYYNAASDSSCTSYRMYSFSNARENFYYTYDANGNITSIGNGIVLRAFEYDTLGQMTVERDRYTNSTTLYTYDDGGNLLQKTVYPDFYGTNGTPTITTYAYEDAVWADRLTGYDGTTIAYDNAGNPLNWRNGTTLTWQNGRQLASATNSDTAVTYTYNQNGIRTSKTVNDVKTTYILDENDRLTGEVTGNNTTVFLYDEGGLVYGFLYNDVPYFYLFNGQGDVVNVVDETGAVVASYNYDAWGNPISASGDMAAINPIRYRGYYYDAETGWYYLQSRYYDPAVGRFINADGIFDENYQLIGYNMYTYARNAPTVFSDPSGEKIVLCGSNTEQKQLIACLQEITNHRLFFYSSGLVDYMGYRKQELCKSILKSPCVVLAATQGGFSFPLGTPFIADAPGGGEYRKQLRECCSVILCKVRFYQKMIHGITAFLVHNTIFVNPILHTAKLCFFRHIGRCRDKRRQDPR